MTSIDWQEQQTREEATAIAHERLARYDLERQERLAAYALVWEARAAAKRQRVALATGEARSLWRLIK